MKKLMLTALCATAVMLGSVSVSAQEEMLPPPPPPHDEMLPQPHPKFGPEHKGPRAHGPKFDKKKHEEMADKFADKLDLTKEQREQAEKIRQDGRKKMEPLMKEMKELRQKMDELRRENMEEFEKILTPEQKKQLDEMKPKHDKRWKADKKHHKKLKAEKKAEKKAKKEDKKD